MWRVIESYPLYEINENGVVRNRNTQYVTTQRMNASGYLYVQLLRDNKNHVCLVHRLVAETFIPNPDSLPIVNHIDECSVHNSVDNLEWVSYKENSNHGTRNERIIRDRKIPVIAFDETGFTFGRYGSKREAARVFNVSEISIRTAINNKNRCCGYYWREYDLNSGDERETNIKWIADSKVNHLTKTIHRKNVPVEALNDTGDSLFRFTSKSEASKKMNVSQTAIATAIKKHTKCCSYYWREIEE